MSWPGAALFSLSDKRGAAEFAAALAARGTRILASGGTAKHLAAAGVPVTPLEEWTGFGELLGGRVKTLHPHVHAPILARRDEPADLAALEERDLVPIDLVAVTLYPFEERAAALDDAGMVEEIDVGGVALLRAAAKNHAAVVVLHDPDQYAAALAALEAGGPTAAERRALALRAFARTARYDAAIAAELERRSGAGEGPPRRGSGQPGASLVSCCGSEGGSRCCGSAVGCCSARFSWRSSIRSARWAARSSGLIITADADSGITTATAERREKTDFRFRLETVVII